MIKFIYQYDDKSPLIEITAQSDSTLPDLLDIFERFIISAGYNFDGVVDIVESEEGEKE